MRKIDERMREFVTCKTLKKTETVWIKRTDENIVFSCHFTLPLRYINNKKGLKKETKLEDVKITNK